jgi:hypothetical protein
MGLTAHSRVIGLEKWSFKMTMLQSFSTADGGENTNSLLSTWYTMSKAGSKFMCTVSVFGGTSTVSVNNPTYSGLVVLKNYSPIQGGVGDLLKTDVAHRVASYFHGGWGQDRVFYAALSQLFPNYGCSGAFTVDYRTRDDLQPKVVELLTRENAAIRQKFGGRLPFVGQPTKAAVAA